MRHVVQIAPALLLVAACGPIADTASNAGDRRYTIALGSQLVDTRATEAQLASTRDDGYALVKFPGPVTAEQLSALTATARVYTYLPHDAFLVRPVGGTASGLSASAL